MKSQQLSLPFGPIRNNHLFSSHWLERRLSLETDWDEHRQKAEQLLGRLGRLWKQQRNRVEKYTEPSLEQAFIQPILAELGWILLYQTFLRGRKPDYALFLDEGDLDRALSAGRKAPSFWNHAILVADAKSWTVNLDRPIEIKKQREYPPEQIEWYIHHSNRQYGILTNGKLWRLYPHDLSDYQPRFDTYLECNLAELLERWVEAGGDRGQRTFSEDTHLIEDFLKFYLFFSPIAFHAIEDRKPLIDRAVHGSNEYRLGVGEGLKDRVFEALRICIQGFLSHKPNKLDPTKDLGICKEQSLILLYQLLFVMYGEDRGLLPYRTNRIYRENRSLSRLRDQIAEKIDNIRQGIDQDYDPNSQNLWDDLSLLFDLVDRGGKRYGVPPYNGGLFDPQENTFLSDKVLPDWYLAQAIDGLSRAPDTEHPDAGLFRVDYRDLSIQHLGHIYEGLLELQPQFPKESMVVICKRGRQKVEERIIPCSQKLPKGFEQTQIRYKPGKLFLVTDKGERRATGSYYTPNHIVDYIVMQTLGPLCREVDNKLVAEIKETETKIKRSRGRNRQLLKEKLERLRNDFDDRILRLRILDPAMGSGHFLIRACQYLAEEIATNPNTGDSIADQLKEDESVLTFWKRRIVEHCLYGVDINPLAVELAKVALWLETAAIDQPLTFLDHHLRHGNSLVGGKIENLGTLPIEKPLPLFENQVSSRLPILLDGLRQISEKPSATRNQVKEKVDIYRKAVDRVRQPFVAVADLWCATFFLDRANQITPDQYQEALQTLGTPARYRKLAKKRWFQTALGIAHRPDMASFHWELEFPEVFFDLSGRREEAGFDAVMANPPYETSRSMGIDEKTKKYLKKKYETAEDKYDYYVFFIEKSSKLVRENGTVCLITPSTFLLKPLSKKLRKYLLSKHEILNITEFKGLVFESVVPTAITVFKKKIADVNHSIQVAYNIDSISSFIDGAFSKSSIKQSIFYKEPNYYINIYADEWFFIFFERLSNQERMIKLGDLAEIYNGIQTGNDKKYVSHEKRSNKWERVLVGRDIQRYYKKWGGKYVYYEPSKLHSNTRKDIFKTDEKIIIRQTSDRITGDYDDERHFTLASTFVIKQFKKLISYKALLGILNSNLFLYLYRNLNNEEGRVLPQIKKKHIFDLPIRVEFVQKQLIELVDKILTVTRDVDYPLDPAKQIKVKELEKQIDQMVYKLYGMTKEEIAIVEGYKKTD